MMSSEERKQIVTYLYKLIKESPLFKDYTDDRIREAAVRAEQKAYANSSSKDEYLRAMNRKAEKIKNTKVHMESPMERVTERVSQAYPRDNVVYGSYARETHQPVYKETHQPAYKETHQPLYKDTHTSVYKDTHPSTYKDVRPSAYKDTHPLAYKEASYHSNQQYGRKEQIHFSQRNQSTYNKGDELYNQPSYQQEGYYSNRDVTSRNQPIFSNFTIKDNNKSQSSLIDRGYNATQREYDRTPLHGINPAFGGGQHHPVSPRNTNESFVYVNELNGAGLRMGENNSFGHSKYEQGGYQSHTPSYQGGYQNNSLQHGTGYITERGFHSNQKLFEQTNYHEQPQYTQFQQPKKLSDFKPQVNNSLKYRQRYDEPLPKGGYPPQDGFLRRGGIQSTGAFLSSQRYPCTSPIGMPQPKKTERSFSIENQSSYSQQTERAYASPGRRQTTRRKEVGQNFGNEDFMRREEKPPLIGDNSRTIYEQKQPLIGDNSRTIYEQKQPVIGDNSRIIYEQKHIKPKKKVDIDESKANELFNSFGSLFEPQNDPGFDNQSNFFEVALSKGGRPVRAEEGRADLKPPSLGKSKKKDLAPTKKHLYRPPKVVSEPKKKSPDLYDDPLDLEPPKKLKPSVVVAPLVVELPPQKEKEPVIKEETIDIPIEIQDFFKANNLNTMDLQNQNLKLLQESLVRCEDTQSRASKIYIEHKKEFPNSKIHKSYLRTTELINKQRECLPYNLYFLTWRCVDDLLDNLKGLYIDMKVELDKAQNAVVIFPDAINSAFSAFVSSKKRDKDFALNLKDK